MRRDKIKSNCIWKEIVGGPSTQTKLLNDDNPRQGSSLVVKNMLHIEKSISYNDIQGILFATSTSKIPIYFYTTLECLCFGKLYLL